MIWESWPWKQDLLRDADILGRWAAKPPTERRSYLVEKKVFFAAYSMRKLLEAGKLSTATMNRSIGCKVYPALSAAISSDNRHHFDELYDLNSPVMRQLPARTLINMIIHSLVFVEGLADNLSLSSFLITSDRTKFDGLWEVPLDAFIRTMRRVGADMPSTYVRALDPVKGSWLIWPGNGEPPKHVEEALAAISRNHARSNPANLNSRSAPARASERKE
ncbi:MAG: hypothetical protein H0W74_05920 [Sphingosinicella sp.]|nr:hypothetical protein [Sphingosinicella sp.]